MVKRSETLPGSEGLEVLSGLCHILFMVSKTIQEVERILDLDSGNLGLGAKSAICLPNIHSPIYLPLQYFHCWCGKLPRLTKYGFPSLP